MSKEHNGLTMRRERKARNMTQLQMSEALGVSIRTYIRYEQHGLPTPVAMLANHVLKGISPRAKGTGQ